MPINPSRSHMAQNYAEGIGHKRFTDIAHQFAIQGECQTSMGKVPLNRRPSSAKACDSHGQRNFICVCRGVQSRYPARCAKSRASRS